MLGSALAVEDSVAAFEREREIVQRKFVSRP